jgi:hypothetical protein
LSIIPQSGSERCKVPSHQVHEWQTSLLRNDFQQLHQVSLEILSIIQKLCLERYHDRKSGYPLQIVVVKSDNSDWHEVALVSQTEFCALINLWS